MRLVVIPRNVRYGSITGTGTVRYDMPAIPCRYNFGPLRLPIMSYRTVPVHVILPYRTFLCTSITTRRTFIGPQFHPTAHTVTYNCTWSISRVHFHTFKSTSTVPVPVPVPYGIDKRREIFSDPG